MSVAGVVKWKVEELTVVDLAETSVLAVLSLGVVRGHGAGAGISGLAHAGAHLARIKPTVHFL